MSFFLKYYQAFEVPTVLTAKNMVDSSKTHSLLKKQREPKYVAAINLSMWRPESLVLIFLCMYSLGADRRGAGNVDGNSDPPVPNFHPNIIVIFEEGITSFLEVLLFF